MNFLPYFILFLLSLLLPLVRTLDFGPYPRRVLSWCPRFLLDSLLYPLSFLRLFLSNRFGFLWSLSKIQGFLWESARRRVLTQDKYQTLNPLSLLCPHICLLCLSNLQSNNQLFIHYPFTWTLWSFLPGQCKLGCSSL